MLRTNPKPKAVKNKKSNGEMGTGADTKITCMILIIALACIVLTLTQALDCQHQTTFAYKLNFSYLCLIEPTHHAYLHRYCQLATKKF